MALTISPAELVAEAEVSRVPGLLARHHTWERVPLGEIANVLNGCAFKSHLFNHDGNGVPLIRIRDVGSKATNTYYSGDYEDQYLVNPGDMIVGMDGDFRAAIWNGPVALLNQRVCKISVRDAECYDPRFLFYVLQGYLDAIGVATSSVTVKHLSSRSVQKIPLPLPPLKEQIRIVEALEDHLSSLDVSSEIVSHARQRIGRFTAAVLDRAALGLWRPAAARGMTGECRSLLDDISSKRFDYAKLPDLPKGWLWRRSSDICESINSGSTPKAHLMHSGSGEVPFLKVYNITQDGRIDFTKNPTYIDEIVHKNQMKRSRVRPGDVLTNIVGPPLGKTAVVPDQYEEWNINQAIVAFRSGSEVHPKWLSLLLRSPFIVGILKDTARATAGQFNISLSTCRELPLPVPPLDVQLDIVAECENLINVSERIAHQARRATLRTRHLRQAILSRAFSGQLVHQDPNDEPASVLLDRIRAERAAQAATRPKRTTRRTRKTEEAAAPTTPPPPLPDSSTPVPSTVVQQELPL